MQSPHPGPEITQNWIEEKRSRLRLLAEEMMKPLEETIRAQGQQLQEQSRARQE
jgi:hypothetical protein